MFSIKNILLCIVRWSCDSSPCSVCPHGHSRMQRQQLAGASDDARPSMPWQPLPFFFFGVLKKLSCSHRKLNRFIFFPSLAFARSGLTSPTLLSAKPLEGLCRSDSIECAMPYCQRQLVYSLSETFSEKGTLRCPYHFQTLTFSNSNAVRFPISSIQTYWSWSIWCNNKILVHRTCSLVLRIGCPPTAVSMNDRA